MSINEIERALRDLRLSGIAATLNTRVMEAQSSQQPFLETLAAMLQDELDRRHSRLTERRFKHSALRDVASMLRSLEYAALSGLRTGALRASDAERLEPFARAWSGWMGAAFLQAYLSTLGAGTGLVPASDQQTSALLEFYLLDKCLYELDYEFNNRPDWVSIPLLGLLGLLGNGQREASSGRDAGAEPDSRAEREPKSVGSIT